MIRKLIRQMLTAQILSALTVSLCLLIDSIIIGRFLGVEGMAAYGLANPILLVIGALASTLSAGVQVVCSKSLGRGQSEETNAGFSSSLAVVALFSIPFMLLVFFFRTPVARLLGAGESELLLNNTKDYIAGFIIGAPATMGALVLVPFLQMAGESTLLIFAVLGMTIGDIALDLLNVLVFHGGMFGMGLASSVSYYIALLIGGYYFLSKKCFFRFSLKQVTLAKIREIFAGGIPTVCNMASSVILVFVMNKLLLSWGGSRLVASFSVISTIGNAVNCISTGIGGVSLTLAGVLYHEEDRTGLLSMTRQMMKYALILGGAVIVLFQILARPAASLFLADDKTVLDMTVKGLRIYVFGIMPCAVNSTLKNVWQGTEREKMTSVYSFMDYALLPIVAALILSLFTKSWGIFAFYAAGEIAAFCFLLVYLYGKTRQNPFEVSRLILLRDDFSVAPEKLFERDLFGIDDVLSASEAVQAFCDHPGDEDDAVAFQMALCIEEMGSNVVLHGFTKDDKEHHLSLRLLEKEEEWILRFRDDCRAFDPVEYVPKRQFGDKLGIGLVLKIADEVRYTYSMNLNNLVIVIKRGKELSA
ncbi:MAG: ATP-binding protein [Lachnospiraceae bacterium]|nr:ATP-binding protein [Lachnospiraceae bacterium]